MNPNPNRMQETKKTQPKKEKKIEKISIIEKPSSNTYRIPPKTEKNQSRNPQNKPLTTFNGQNSQKIDCEVDIYERLKKNVPNVMITNDKSLLDDIENQEVCFLKNNCMPLELEYTNPQIKNFYKPQVKVLQVKNVKEENFQKTKNPQIHKTEKAERRNSKIELGSKQSFNEQSQGIYHNYF